MPRPQNDAVRRHIGKIADKLEIFCFMRTISTQVAARFGALGRFRALRLGAGAEFRILVSLRQHGAPDFELGRDDWFVHPCLWRERCCFRPSVLRLDPHRRSMTQTGFVEILPARP